MVQGATGAREDASFLRGEECRGSHTECCILWENACILAWAALYNSSREEVSILRDFIKRTGCEMHTGRLAVLVKARAATGPSGIIDRMGLKVINCTD